MAIGSHQSSAPLTVTWLTPPEIIGELGPFDLDPCTPITMPWLTAGKRYTHIDDGLARPWFGRVWLNPPYTSGEVDRWMERMARHGIGTALLFARTETECWHRHIWERASAILFLEGRLNFHHNSGERAKANAGAPSALIAYGLHDADVLEGCKLDGAFVPLGCRGQTVLVLRHEDHPDITWADLVTMIAERQGGKVSVQAAYALIANHPKARRNPNWQAKVRQTLQLVAHRTGPGQYAIGAL